MRALVCASLCLLCLPLSAQMLCSDGYIEVETRQQVQQAPRDARLVRARDLPAADMATLARFTQLEKLDLRCHASLDDTSLSALHRLPPGTEVDIRGCPRLSAAAVSALAGNDWFRYGRPLMLVVWNPATLADGQILEVNGANCVLNIGTGHGAHKGQRFECYDNDPALNGRFTGVVEVTEPGPATSKGVILYHARDAAVKASDTLVNRLWRDGRYLNFALAGDFADNTGFLTLAEILDGMESLGARRQEREFMLSPATELVIGGSDLFSDEGYRWLRLHWSFAFVRESGLRLYFDPAPSTHRLDPDGVAHLADTAALRRCLSGLDAVHLDRLDPKGVEILRQWNLTRLTAESLSGVTTAMLATVLSNRTWKALALTGPCPGTDDPFANVSFAFGLETFRLEGRKGADGKHQAPPITAGLLKALYTTAEEDRAHVTHLSFRGNPNLTAATLRYLPAWWHVETLDVSDCPGLDDAAVRELFRPSEPDHVYGEALRNTQRLILSDNPQLTDAAFDFGDVEPFVQDGMRVDLVGCSGLTDLALRRLAAAGVKHMVVSRRQRFTEAGVKALDPAVRVTRVEDIAFTKTRVMDDPRAEPQPEVFVVRDDKTLAALPRGARRVRFEGNDTGVLAKLWGHDGIAELDLSGNDNLKGLPGDWWQPHLRRLDLRGCTGLYAPESAPLAVLEYLKEQSNIHLALDGAHMFAPVAPPPDAKKTEARAFVAAWRKFVEARLAVDYGDKLDDAAQRAAQDALQDRELEWIGVRDDARYDPVLSRAIVAELDAVLGALLEAFRVAGASLVAKPDSEQAQRQHAQAHRWLKEIAILPRRLHGGALLFDPGWAALLGRYSKAAADYAGQLADLETEYEAAAGDAARELHRRITAVKDLARELAATRPDPGDNARPELEASVHRLSRLLSLRVANAAHWRGGELAALVAAVPCRLELDLAGNPNLTDADIDVLLSARRLGAVNLKGCTGISDAAVKRLAELRPGTRVER
jgi:hypothetical protein